MLAVVFLTSNVYAGKHKKDKKYKKEIKKLEQKLKKADQEILLLKEALDEAEQAYKQILAEQADIQNQESTCPSPEPCPEIECEAESTGIVICNGCDFYGDGNSEFADHNFADAKLQDTDFYMAILTGSNFFEADLTGAAMERADLKGAVLTGATLTGARLGGADLTGADLTGAEITDVKWSISVWDDDANAVVKLHTVCPDGTKADADDGDGETCENNLKLPLQ